MCGMRFTAWSGLEEGVCPPAAPGGVSGPPGWPYGGGAVSGVPSASLYRETGKGAEDRAQTPPSLSGKPEKGFLRRDRQSKSTEMAGDITNVRGTNVLNTAELR